MHSTDIANLFICRHGEHIRLTNLSLNKLVYFAQVESLRTDGMPLFSDAIEAWEYGPVEPAVYHAFKGYGRSAITRPTSDFDCSAMSDARAITAVDAVADRYGRLMPFDLVELSHRDGGAWRNLYAPGADVRITDADIMASADYLSVPDLSRTLASNVESVRERWGNTLRMLEDA